MELNIDYSPVLWRRFNDDKHLSNYVNAMMRTDVTRRGEGPYTRNNLYFIRKDGELQHFQCVNTYYQRKELKTVILDLCRRLPLSMLHNDRVFVTPFPDATLRQENFQDIVEDILPGLWRANCPFAGQEDHYLDATIAIIMHNDESYDGEELLCNLHRIYVRDYHVLSDLPLCHE